MPRNRLLLPLLMLLAGCSSGPRTHPISGTVAFDGVPVANGDILFFPADGKQGPDAGKITDGKFELAVKEGSHKVEIRAVKILPPPPGKKAYMGDGTIPLQYIPARYNEKTELRADVPATAPLEFKLSSAAR